MTYKEIIKHYDLSQHPEGGFYRRTYASTVATSFRGSNRPVCTAYSVFFLKAGQYPRLHRIPQDEMRHFYLGDPLTMIAPDGEPLFPMKTGQCVAQIKPFSNFPNTVLTYTPVGYI